MFAGNRLKTKLFAAVALLSLLAAALLPMSAFAAEAESAVEPSVSGDSPAAIQADALQPAQDGEGVANAELLRVSGEGADEPAEAGNVVEAAPRVSGEDGGETASDSTEKPAEGGAGADAIEAEGGALGAAEAGGEAESPVGTPETPGKSKKASEGEDGSDDAVTCTVTVSANPPEGGTVGGGGDYAIGDSATVTATASEYYTFVGWFEDEEQVSAYASYTFTVAGSRTLIAVFDVQEYEVAEGGGHSTGSAHEHADATLITGGVLDGAAIRLRPQGSYRQVTVQNDGIGGELYVQLFDIRATSRLELIQVEDSDDCYYISYYETYYDTQPHYNKYYYLRPYKDETLGTIRVNTLINSDSCEWKFYRLDDGTYWIKNADSGLYLSLMEPDNINKYEGTLVQRGTRVKWEIEFVRGPQKGNAPRNDLKEYDSYTFEYSDGDSSVSVTSANWMSCLPDEAYLADLSIPGVHDAGTVNVGGVFQGPSTEEDNSWKCQQLYIDDMLTNGVRYFDLRLSDRGIYTDNNGIPTRQIVVQHGSGVTKSVCQDRDGNNLTADTIMKWTTAFLKAHPGETVILAIKDEDGGDSSDEIYEWLRAYWEGHLDLIYTGNGNPQLGDVRGKIVLISRIDETDSKGNVIRPYHTVPNDFSSPAWAIYVDWFRGENYAPKLAASTDAYDFWTQDRYHITPDEKWKWIEQCILGDGATSAKGLHDQATSQGKGAWVVNFTSTEIDEELKYPVICARNINNRLKQADKFGTEADEYVGIVCVDFIDEQLAQRIYAINFRYALLRQEVTFGAPMQFKVYGEKPFRFKAFTTGDGAISYVTSDPSVATVDDSGLVTIHGAGTAIITATAAATDSYLESSGSYSLLVNRAAIAVSAESRDPLYYGSPIELSLVIVEGSLKYEDQIDSLGIRLSTDATDTSDVGEYSVRLTGGTKNSNYVVRLVPGTLTISPRPVGVEVADSTVTYNGSWQYGESTYSFTSLQYVALLEGHTATITYMPSSGVDASEAAYGNGEFGHDFRVIDENGVDRTSNYILTRAVPGKLTIKPAKATITVSSASKVQGEADPSFTGTVEGLVYEDDLGEVTYTRVNGDEEPGIYRGVLTATYTANPNYDVHVAKGDFTIATPGYTVSFDANVPTSASTTCSGAMDDQDFSRSETKALSGNGYSLPGYNFEGWNTKADGTGTAYADGAEVQGLSEDGGTVTLYAQWSGKPYTIEYWSDDAGSQKHVQTAYFDRPANLDTYSDSNFGWNSGGKTLHGWHGQGSGPFLEDGDDFVNLCGAPDADGNVSDPVIVADWVNNGQIVVSVTKDGAPQAGLRNHFKLLQGYIMYDNVSISYWNGRYVFNPMPGTDLPEGEYDLLFEANGYPSASARIIYANNHAASVVFDYYTVSLNRDPVYASAESIAINGEEAVIVGDATVLVLDGRTVDIETTVSEGYNFTGYTAVGVAPVWEDGDSSKAKQTIVVQGKADITANAEPIEYTVTVVNGTSDVATAHVGDIIAITANKLKSGKAFVQWAHVDGVGYERADAFETTFTMPAMDVTITAVFKEIMLPDIADQPYTGEEIEPTFGLFDVTLDGVDAVFPDRYALSYEDNVNAGTATVTLTFKDPATGEPDSRLGTKSTTFKITPADISGVGVTATGQVYDGTELKPTPVVTWNGETLDAVKDFEVTGYADNVHAGSATVTVTGKGNFTGTASGTFTIAPRPATITVDSASKVQYDADPPFTGTVEGLAVEGDLGEVSYKRTNDDEGPGVYKGVLTATYTANADYDVTVVTGGFTIKTLLTVTWLDGDGSALQAKTYGEGDEPPAYDGKEPTRAATTQYTYTFSSWDGGTVDGTTTTYRPLFDAAVNFYGISLDLAGGTLDGQGGIVVRDIAYGSTITLPKPTREGYTFQYWEGSRYDAGDKYLVEGAHTFTAKWEKNAGSTPGNPGGGTPAAADIAPAAYDVPAAPAAATPAPTATTPATPVANNATPLAQGIGDDTNALGDGAGRGSWSLFDVLAAALAVVLAAVMLFGALGRNRKDEEGGDGSIAEKAFKRKRALGIAGIVPGIAALALAAVTQDFSQPMAIFDQWSIAFGVIAIANIALAVASRKAAGDGGDGQGSAPTGGYVPASPAGL